MFVDTTSLQVPSRLLSLPEEILIYILSLVGTPTLIRCALLCRQINNTIVETMLLTYQIELFSDGLADGQGCSLTLADRFSLLRSRRESWSKLGFHGTSFPISSGIWNAYELVDGVFAQTLNLSSANASRGIQFACLPSWNYDGAIIRFDDVGFAFRDFAIDPTQNLVVYLQCEPISPDDNEAIQTNVTLYLRTLTMNKPHPRARQPTISLIVQGEVSGAVIQVVDDVIGFLSWDQLGSRLYIWDWTQPSLLVGKPNLSKLNDFAFISSRAFTLIAPHHSSHINLYTESDDDGRSGAILRAKLYLPETCPGAEIGILGIHTGPFVTPHPAPQCLRPPKPFVTAPNARIHVVNIDLYAPDRVSITSCLIVIHNSTFLKYIEAGIAQGDAISVPWRDWGVQHTYWIMGHTGSQWLRYVQGERLVRLLRTAEGEQLEIYDFGVPRGQLRWPMSGNTPKPNPMMVLDKVFLENVSFEMLCRTTVRTQKKQYSGFMIDEDKLIGVKVSTSRRRGLRKH
ncbi:hypothetical protein BU17DRAFT_55677 [Hysterangium stoloniferum]|nr:hypothetical protein BU17DRAFT_55677 [Hysterangium stoloniferum]